MDSSDCSPNYDARPRTRRQSSQSPTPSSRLPSPHPHKQGTDHEEGSTNRSTSSERSRRSSSRSPPKTRPPSPSPFTKVDLATNGEEEERSSRSNNSSKKSNRSSSQSSQRSNNSSRKKSNRSNSNNKRGPLLPPPPDTNGRNKSEKKTSLPPKRRNSETTLTNKNNDATCISPTSIHDTPPLPSELSPELLLPGHHSYSIPPFKEGTLTDEVVESNVSPPKSKPPPSKIESNSSIHSQLLLSDRIQENGKRSSSSSKSSNVGGSFTEMPSPASTIDSMPFIPPPPPPRHRRPSGSIVNSSRPRLPPTMISIENDNNETSSPRLAKNHNSDPKARPMLGLSEKNSSDRTRPVVFQPPPPLPSFYAPPPPRRHSYHFTPSSPGPGSPGQILNAKRNSFAGSSSRQELMSSGGGGTPTPTRKARSNSFAGSTRPPPPPRHNRTPSPARSICQELMNSSGGNPTLKAKSNSFSGSTPTRLALSSGGTPPTSTWKAKSISFAGSTRPPPRHNRTPSPAGSICQELMSSSGGNPTLKAKSNSFAGSTRPPPPRHNRTPSPARSICQELMSSSGGNPTLKAKSNSFAGSTRPPPRHNRTPSPAGSICQELMSSSGGNPTLKAKSNSFAGSTRPPPPPRHNRTPSPSGRNSRQELLSSSGTPTMKAESNSFAGSMPPRYRAPSRAGSICQESIRSSGGTPPTLKAKSNSFAGSTRPHRHRTPSPAGRSICQESISSSGGTPPPWKAKSNSFAGSSRSSTDVISRSTTLNKSRNNSFTVTGPSRSSTISKRVLPGLSRISTPWFGDTTDANTAANSDQDHDDSVVPFPSRLVRQDVQRKQQQQKQVTAPSKVDWDGSVDNNTTGTTTNNINAAATTTTTTDNEEEEASAKLLKLIREMNYPPPNDFDDNATSTKTKEKKKRKKKKKDRKKDNSSNAYDTNNLTWDNASYSYISTAEDNMASNSPVDVNTKKISWDDNASYSHISNEVNNMANTQTVATKQGSWDNDASYSYKSTDDNNNMAIATLPSNAVTKKEKRKKKKKTKKKEKSSILSWDNASHSYISTADMEKKVASEYLLEAAQQIEKEGQLAREEVNMRNVNGVTNLTMTKKMERKIKKNRDRHNLDLERLISEEKEGEDSVLLWTDDERNSDESDNDGKNGEKNASATTTFASPDDYIVDHVEDGSTSKSDSLVTHDSIASTTRSYYPHAGWDDGTDSTGRYPHHRHYSYDNPMKSSGGGGSSSSMPYHNNNNNNNMNAAKKKKSKTQSNMQYAHVFCEQIKEIGDGNAKGQKEHDVQYEYANAFSEQIKEIAPIMEGSDEEEGGGGEHQQQQQRHHRKIRVLCQRDNIFVMRFTLFLVVGGAVVLLLCIIPLTNFKKDDVLRDNGESRNVFPTTTTTGEDDGGYNHNANIIIDINSNNDNNTIYIAPKQQPNVGSSMDTFVERGDALGVTSSTSLIGASPEADPVMTTTDYDLTTAEKGKSYGILFDVETIPGSSSSPPVTISGMDLYLVDAASLPTHYEIWTKMGSWEDNADQVSTTTTTTDDEEPTPQYLSGFRQVSQGTITEKGGGTSTIGSSSSSSSNGDDFTIVSLPEFQNVEISGGGDRRAFYVTLSDDLLLFESYGGKGGGENENGIVAPDSGSVALGGGGGRHGIMRSVVQASTDEFRVYYGAAVRAYPLELADPTTDFWNNAGFLGRIWTS